MRDKHSKKEVYNQFIIDCTRTFGLEDLPEVKKHMKKKFNAFTYNETLIIFNALCSHVSSLSKNIEGLTYGSPEHRKTKDELRTTSELISFFSKKI